MKFKNYLSVALLVVLTAASAACKSRSELANKANETQDRHLSGFNAIKLTGSYDLYVTQGNTESVKVEAPAARMNEVLTSVSGGTLFISSENKHGWSIGWSDNDKVVVYVTIKDVNAITLNGSGDVYFKDGLKADKLSLSVTGSGDITGKISVKTLNTRITGSGDVTLTGNAASANVMVAGSGDYRAKNMVTAQTAVRVSGSGDASVHADSKLEAVVNGSGDVSYTGSVTQISTSKTGSGDIERM